ncbi:MAG: hypothetical protein II277_01715 [Bacteroidales bacterium]|nr:hypothetical protein [Bacteroidales bacterium]
MFSALISKSLLSIEDYLDKNRLNEAPLRAALAFKKISLACLLLREKQLAQAQLDYWKNYARKARREVAKKYRPLLALHEAYSKRGGRAFWRIFALFV